MPWTYLTRVGRNRIYLLYMTVYLVNFLPNMPCVYVLYVYMATLHLNPYTAVFNIGHGSGRPKFITMGKSDNSLGCGHQP